MIIKIIKKIFGSRNERILKKIKKIVNIINNKETIIKNLSDKKLSMKTDEFKKLIQSGISIDDILPEAYAVVREASKRIFGIRHFDVQLMGGIVLNDRCIAEMRTGEGKTLTATLPAYLNALSGNSVHIVTVNDYLTKRDSENISPLFEFLKLKVGVNLSGMSVLQKKSAYSSDIVYGTNNEYCFDYLRDNLIFSLTEKVQKKLNFAIIDEIDSILIDEARTPCIISGSAENNSDIYYNINKIIPYLIKKNNEDTTSIKSEKYFTIDEKSKQIYLTEKGLILIEKILVKKNLLNLNESLYLPNNIILIHHITSSLRAHILFNKNIDYIVKNGEVIIIDEHTGRIMNGRRWSEGLHQAIEAKEELFIHNENKIFASITLQNYFRLYKKISGMTGTAYTEAFEFQSIYKLDTIVIPTNRPMIRKDLSDLIYMTKKEKINAIIKDIKSCKKTGQPVLVGTTSIEKSELISNILKNLKIKHKVLNAKFHDIEAEIISKAGKIGSVTIATNMAGRGTDIVLGGNFELEKISKKKENKKKYILYKKKWQYLHDTVINLGGLHIIGTERHESRRIDNQLIGRSGRQGDPGSSRFYLSMEDFLMRMFLPKNISIIMNNLGLKFGESIEHPLLTKAIAHAQKKVEINNFNIRKQLLEFDDVLNEHRKVIYNKRNEILSMSNIEEIIKNIRKEVIKTILNRFIFNHFEKELNFIKLEILLKEEFNITISIKNLLKDKFKINKKLYKKILKLLILQYKHKENIFGYNIMRNLEKNIFLQNIDILWREHLLFMEYLRQGIHLRGYAQKDPKQEYKRESFLMFTSMLKTIKYEVIKNLSKI